MIIKIPATCIYNGNMLFKNYTHGYVNTKP